MASTEQASLEAEERRRKVEAVRKAAADLHVVSNAMQDALARLGPLAKRVDEAVAAVEAILPPERK